MTFETKSLVHIVVWGPLTTPIKTSLSPKSQLFTLSSERHILLYGAHQRQENDAEEALSMALKLRNSNLKIFVTTENVLIKSNQPQVSWNDQWNKTFEALSPNEIAVSLDLVRIYQRIFEINAKRIKNESVFLLKEKKSKPDRIRGIQKKYTPLVGRKKELNALLEVVEQSFEDQGQIASIIGDAGLGKTRLTAEFKSELVKRNIRCYEGLFSLNSDMNFRGFHQIVAQLLENNTETFSRWNLNPTESAFLRFFLHPEEKFDELKDLNETELTQGIFHSIQKLLSIVGQQPIVLILDDFHWAGERSVELMDALSTMIEKTRIAFILIHRPSFTPSFQKKLNYHQIKLNPLQHDETKELVKNTLHLDYITDGAIETLNNLSLGNPLFVEEVLRELINRKELDIQKDEDLVRLIQIKFPQGVIPTNIQSLITARLDLLTKEAKKILQWVCAFGFRENHDDFELFLQTMHLSLDEFHSLFEQGYLEEASMFPEHKYKFTHDLLYETVKQSVPEQTWKEKNQKIAEFLYNVYKNEMIVQGDRIADFFIKGSIDQNSFEPIFEAAKIALSQKRYSSSIKYFNECIRAHKESSLATINPTELYEPYIEALFASGEKENARQGINTWKKEGFTNSSDEIKFYKKNLEFLYNYRELNQLEQVSREAFNKYTFDKNESANLNFRVKHCQALAYLFRFEEASHTALDLLRKINSKAELYELKIDLYYVLGFITQQTGFPNVGSHLTLIAKDIADKTNSFKLKSMIYKRIGFLATGQGFYEEAVRVWSDLLYSSEQNGYMSDVLIFKYSRPLNNYFLGKYTECLHEVKYFDEFDNFDWHKKFIANWTGQAYLAVGSFENAKKLISTHRHFPSRDPYIRSNLFYLIGNYHLQQNQYRKARIAYSYGRKLYEKKSQKIYAHQMQLFELRCKLLLKEITPEKAAMEFDSIIANPEMRKYFYEWNTQMLSFWFARHGCKTRFKPSEDYDPMKCNAVYLRMMMFVEKIKWLQSIGKNFEANQLRDQYLKHRQEMAFYVPEEFKQSYLEHPFYKV